MLEDYQLSNIPISQLSDISQPYDGIDDEAYFLISQPWEDGLSKYISEKVKYSQLRNQIVEDIDIEYLSSCIADIYDNYISYLSGTHVISIDSFEYPYMLCSVAEYNGSIVNMKGYRLWQAMDYVFKNHMFEQISAERLYAVSAVIAQLTAWTAYADSISAKSMDVSSMHIASLSADRINTAYISAAEANLSVINAVCAFVAECDAEPAENSTNILNSNALYNTMKKYFMEGYSADNKLAHEDFVNSSIDHVAAFYITKMHAGEDTPSTFRTHADLAQAELSDLYWGVDRRNPTKNDYCVVLSDETHLDTGDPQKPQTTRYLFTAISCDESTYTSADWTFQYIVNTAPFTAEQWKAINSGIEKDTVVTRDRLSGCGSYYIPVYVADTGKVTACCQVSSALQLETAFGAINSKIDAQLTKLNSIV